MVGAMPAIIAFMLMNSGKKVLRTFVPIAAAHDLLHEKRLKDEVSKSESRKVLDNKIDAHWQAQRDRNNRSKDNAGCIASYAVNRAAYTLLPKR